MKSAFELKASLALVAAFCVTGTAVAQTYPKEGNYDYTACWSGVSNVLAFSKTHSAATFEFTGTVQTNPGGGIFDRTTFRCVGMNQLFDGKPLATVVCEGVDAQGDKVLSHYSTEGSKTVRTTVLGTGKYEGMVSSGTAVPVGSFPVAKPGTFQNCNRQTGTYKLK